MVLELIEATMAPAEMDAIRTVASAGMERAMELGGLRAHWIAEDRATGTLLACLLWESRAAVAAAEELRLRVTGIARGLGSGPVTRRLLDVRDWSGLDEG